jgi:hypothetical protein
MANDKEDVIRVLAEQSYSFHLLVKQLRESGYLKLGEPMNAWSDAEFEHFLADFRGNYFPGVIP